MTARGELQRSRDARRREAKRLDQRAFVDGRRAVQERSNHACEARTAADCAGLGNQAHHRLRRAHGGTNTPDNLLWVCTPCHDQIHAHPAESFMAGFLIRGVK